MRTSVIFRILLGQQTYRGPSLVDLHSDYVNINVQFLYMYM